MFVVLSGFSRRLEPVYRAPEGANGEERLQQTVDVASGALVYEAPVARRFVTVLDVLIEIAIDGSDSLAEVLAVALVVAVQEHFRRHAELESQALIEQVVRRVLIGV